MANDHMPCLTIGPTIPSSYLDNRVANDSDYSINLFHTDNSFTSNWLSTKPRGSVVYVAFGSMASLDEKQMEELVFGLMNSNCNFLWVVRASEDEKLPKDSNFMEQVSKKGLIVRWSPQLEILSNEAIGCFFSHCGWNSTIEALSLGVPIVAMPQWTDQTTNAKLVQDLWKMGIRVRVDEKGLVGREEIETCIKEVLEGERGKEMKKNALKWKELAKEALSEGGTSDNNIEALVSKLTK
ncbi:transferase [Lithospermum erythrorhizon]|uniref:Transferase n=1 Tax=Lithospermum erythrorhizon TaxID=34254 RepID=A0AAV3QMM0_LITER